MPDEIKPEPYIVLPEPGTLSLACKGSFGYEQKGSMGIVVNFTTRTVQFGLFPPATMTGLDDARVAFGEKEENGVSSGTSFVGTIDRVTGYTEVKTAGGTYSLQCKPVQ
jgi:hypothetical protein